MSGCVYREEDGKCRKFSGEGITSFCVDGPCEDARPSNADRIRAMNDEELADYAYRDLGNYCCPPERECATTTCNDMNANCKKCWIDWLKQEATDD